MTKKEYRTAREEWTKALAAGLVVKLDLGASVSMRSYPTIAMRDAAIAEAELSGYDVSIVSAQ